jgi:hypothetical protein
MSAIQAAVIAVFILVIVAVLTRVGTRLRHRSIRQTADAEAWASFQRRMKQVLRQRTETPEDPNRREVTEFRPARPAADLWPRPWTRAQLEAQRQRLWRRHGYYHYWT